MTDTTTTETTADFVRSNTVTPRWMQEVVDAANEADRDVRVTRRSLPFGQYVVAVKVA